MKTTLLLLFAAFPAIAQQSVSKDKALDLAGNVHVIFEHKCNECHGSQLKKPEGKFGYVLDLKRMADNEEYVIRGKPQKSELFRLVNEGEMPPDDHPKTPPLTADEKDVVRRWIQAGAPHELPAVLPKRTFAAPPPPKPKVTKDIRVTLDVRDQPAGQLFADIAKQAKIEIAYTAPKNDPKLSITLKNGKLSEALDYLVLCGNLTLAWDGEKAVIKPPGSEPAAPKAAELAKFVTTWGKEGDAPGDFNIPIGIAINAKNEVFVTDHYNSRVQKFDANGKLLAHFAVLPNPGGIAVDGDRLYLTHFPASRLRKDKTPDRVSVYAQDGTFIREWGSSGDGDGQLNFPGSIVVSAKGEVFVADETNRRVQVFDREGKFLRKWGEHGVKPGQFGGNTNPKSRVGGPNFLAFDRDGSLFTTEASMGRVQSFDLSGKPQLAWGTLDDKPGSFGGAFTGFKANLVGCIGICFDHSNRAWVTAVSGRVQCFTREGKFLGGIVSQQGTKPGEFYAPHGIAVNSRDELFVVDSYNHRVQKFAVTTAK